MAEPDELDSFFDVEIESPVNQLEQQGDGLDAFFDAPDPVIAESPFDDGSEEELNRFFDSKKTADQDLNSFFDEDEELEDFAPTPFGQQAMSILMKSITPIPMLAEGKRKLNADVRESIESVRKFIPKVGQPQTVIGEALKAVRNSLIPIPTTEIAAGAVEVLAPVSPLDLIAEASFGTIPALLRVLKGFRMSRKATIVAKAAKKNMTVAESVERLGAIAEEAAKKPEPLIKVVSSAASKQELSSMVRLGRKRLLRDELPLKVSPLEGLERTGRAVRAVEDEIADKIAGGQKLTIDESKKTFEIVGDMVESGEIDAAAAARQLGIENIAQVDPVQMAKIIKESASKHGRALQQWARIAERLDDVVKNNPEAKAILGRTIKKADGSFLMENFRSFESLRRGMMVGQLATTQRNIISQTGSYAANTFSRAVNGVLGTMSGKIPVRDTLASAGEDLFSFFRALKPKGRADIRKLMDKFPLQKDRLFTSPIQNASMSNKLVKFVNTLNTGQEFFFRTAVVDARIRGIARKRGFDLATESHLLRNSDIREAVDEALELTFAAQPQGDYAKALLKVMSHPVATAVGNPFPRFLMNAMRWNYEFSPLPLFSPSTYSKLASKDPDVAFKALSKAFTGTGMMAAGFAADRMGITGEKWYQVKGDDGKTFDIRPFAPFAVPFFVGRLVSRLQKDGEIAVLQIPRNEWSQAMLSMRRTDLFGIPILDAMSRTKDVKTFQNELVRFASNYAGSFTVPLKTFDDLVNGVADLAGDPEALLPRTSRTEPVFGKIKQNIPFLSRSLPTRPSPLRKGLEKVSSPLLKQFTGLTFKRETPVETESNRLGLSFIDLYPNTGMPEFNRIIVNEMGPIAETVLEKLMASEAYRNPPEKIARNNTERFKWQQRLFKEFLKIPKQVGQDLATAERPDLAIQDMAGRMDGLLEDILQERFEALEE